MSLPHGLLGLLTYSDSTGYDLSKEFGDSLNFFWNAQSSQIYRELNRLEDTGFVTSRSIVQDKRPNKRLYSITQAGREELYRWLREFQFQPENNHHAMLMRIFFGAEIAPEETITLLEECRRLCLEGLGVLNAIALKNVDDYSQAVAGGKEKQIYWRMTIDFGACQTKAMIEWAERCIAQIQKELQ